MVKLKKRYFWIYLILNVISLGLFTFYIAYKLDLYDKDAWYHRWYYWVLGFILGIFPALVMFLVFSVKMGCLVSARLKVPGEEIYLPPYVWIVSLIIPILGWTVFIILYFYVHFWYFFSLKDYLRS